MKLYRLKVAPDESDGEGEDHDEWFTSLIAAQKRRRYLIKNTPNDGYRYGEDFEVSEVVFVELPPRALLLRVLNRTAFIDTSRVMMPAHKPAQAIPAAEEEQ